MSKTTRKHTKKHPQRTPKLKFDERQGRVAIEYLRDPRGNMHAAMLKAGYSKSYAKAYAHKARETPWFKAALEHYRPMLLKQPIMDVEEADRILTEICRATVPDYMEVLPDGTWSIAIDKDSPNPHAIHSVKSRLDLSGEGDTPTAVTEFKLCEKRAALQLWYQRMGLLVQNINVKRSTIDEAMDELDGVDGND